MPEPTALIETMPAVTTPTDPAIAIALELLKRPDLTPEVAQQYLDVGERAARRHAETEFNQAFPRLQASLPTVVEKGRSVTGSYAKNEDIIEAIRPKLREHGFGLTHEIEFLDGGRIRVRGRLTHIAGHSITSEFISVADASGSKNSIQGLGSTQSYGRRYTTCALLNIATRGEDDNGQKGGGTAAPEGMEQWLMDLEAAADTGWPAFEAAWKGSAVVFKNHLQRYSRDTWPALKLRAQKAGK
jgi:hypothetical protein